MILVTGAAGKTGLAVIRALRRRDAPVRALVHRAAQRALVQQAGATEVVSGDLQEEASLRRALSGVRALYLICPNVHPAEEEIGRLAIHAARAAGVDLFVYHSVFHPHIEAMPHHWRKMRVEAHIFESGLPFVILQPAPYLQNLLAQRDEIVNEGRLALPYAVGSRLSAVDLTEVAEVAARVLTEPGHAGATYELCGTAPRSTDEIAQLAARVLGRPVRPQTVPLDVWEARARARGLGDDAVASLRQMFRYYERYGYCGNPRLLTWLLGRAPTDHAAFLQRALGTDPS